MRVTVAMAGLAGSLSDIRLNNVLNQTSRVKCAPPCDPSMRNLPGPVVRVFVWCRASITY